MFTEPRRLIGETIDKLETISAYFSDEVEELKTTSMGNAPVEALAAREALQTIQILIPKLRTAQSNLAAGSPQMRIRECLNCE